jgi:hypothetical protein
MFPSHHGGFASAEGPWPGKPVEFGARLSEVLASDVDCAPTRPPGPAGVLAGWRAGVLEWVSLTVTKPTNLRARNLRMRRLRWRM